MQDIAALVAGNLTAQIIFTDTQTEADTIGRVIVGPIYIIWDAETKDYSALFGRDVAVFSELEPILLHRAKPERLRWCNTEKNPVPAGFTKQWAGAHLDRYPPPDTESAPGMAQAATPAIVAAPPAAPLSTSPVADIDLDAITGDFTPEDMPDGHPAVDTPPDDDLSATRPINGHLAAEVSRIWVKSEPEYWALPVNPFDDQRPPPELDLSDLPDWLRTGCMDEAALKGTDPGVHALTKMGCLAAWCHESWRLQIKQKDTTWRESPRIWTFSYGHSSDGKTIALNMAAAAAVALDTLAGKQGAVLMAKWQSDKRIRDRQVDDYEKRASQNKLNPGEVMPEDVDPPELDKRRFTNATQEGLRTLLELTPKAWLHTDELGGFISALGRFTPTGDGGEREFFMQSWDGGPYDSLRRAGNISVKSLSMCVTGCLTTSSLIKSLGNAKLTEDGLLQRFAIYHCREQVNDSDHELDEDAAESFRRALANLRRMRPVNDKPLRLAPAAYVEFCRFEDEMKELATSGAYSSGCKSSLLKYRSHCPRLALTLHLAMRAEANQECGEAEWVDDAMIIAIHICRQLLAHTTYFWSHTLGEGNQIINQEILQICELIACLHLDKPTFGIAKIASTYRSWWPQKTNAQKAQLLTALQDMNWLGQHPGAQQQAPGVMTSYRLHPALRQMFGNMPLIVNARQRRLATAARLRAASEAASAARLQ